MIYHFAKFGKLGGNVTQIGILSHIKKGKISNRRAGRSVHGRQIWSTVVLLAASVVCPSVLTDQVRAAINRGMIRGSVTDPQGALVIAATVTVTNVETQVSQTSQTNGAGFYLIPELVPGRYKVHFELAGFVPVDVNEVVVRANDVATVDI